MASKNALPPGPYEFAPATEPDDGMEYQIIAAGEHVATVYGQWNVSGSGKALAQFIVECLQRRQP